MATRELPWTVGYRAFEREVQSFEDLHREMRNWGIELRADGVLLFGGDEIGVWEPRRLDDPLLVGDDSPCPLVGPRIGALALDVNGWASDANARHELFCGLMKEGRDVIAHRPSRQHWQAIRLQARSARLSCEKYSLDDGAELVTRGEGDYVAWMIDAVRTACAAAGARPDLYWASTHHNCLRVMDEPPPDSIPDVQVSLWLYDFEILHHIEQRFLDDNA